MSSTKTAKVAQYRLTAHEFEERDGFIATTLHLGGSAPRTIVGAATFAELEALIDAFGTAHAPCNVWVSCQTKPKPRGFDKWNKTPHRLFRAAKSEPTVQLLEPLCNCPKCGKLAIVELTPAQRLAQPDDTTHVCHPALAGCNHGFTDDRTR